MNHYEMRAMSVTGQLVKFSITDAPIIIRENKFILFDRDNSPILKKSPITRSINHMNLFEGDILEYEGDEYCVVDNSDFCLQRKDGVLLPLDSIQNFVVKGTIYSEKDWNIPIRSKLQFRCRDVVFSMEDILGTYKGKVLLGSTNERLDPSEFQQDACTTYQSRRLFFGDLVDGVPLVLYKGKPAIQNNGKYYALPNKKEII